MNKQLLSFMALALMLAGCQNEQKNQNAKPILVKTTLAGMSTTNGEQSYSGTIEEMSGTELSFSGAGTLQNICVDEGQMVSCGQTIATIDPQSVRNAYTISKSALTQAEDAYARMKQLHDNGSLPEMQWIEVNTKLQQARAQEQIARKSLKDTRLIAPFSGYIARKDAEMGQNIMPGTPVVKLVKIDNVKVKISVPEKEISHFRNDQTLNIHVEALNNQNFIGKVDEKSVEANPLSHSYDIKAIVGNKEHKLLPGMICKVDAHVSDVSGGVISLPANIIQLDADNKTFVWTAVNGKAHKTYVATGNNIGYGVEIIGGLVSSDKIIVEGQQKVSEGTKISTKN
jgi:membrane fusion protein (multidrug efflux system)